jgi:hypothetical protein
MKFLLRALRGYPIIRSGGQKIDETSENNNLFLGLLLNDAVSIETRI